MVSFYDATIPVYTTALENMLTYLKKGEQWADENKVPHSKLIEGRLAPDMNVRSRNALCRLIIFLISRCKPLPFQVQSACNTAKGALTRLAGQENVPFEDNETTFAQFYVRIQATIDLLKAAKPEDFEGKENTEVSLMNGKYVLPGTTYMTQFGVSFNLQGKVYVQC